MSINATFFACCGDIRTSQRSLNNCLGIGICWRFGKDSEDHAKIPRRHLKLRIVGINRHECWRLLDLPIQICANCLAIGCKKPGHQYLHAHIKEDMIKKKPVNLTLPEQLVQETKIQAVRENRTFSEIVEQLLKEYLESQTGRKKSKS